MKQLDLLLINPGGREKIYQILAKEFSAIEPPVWAGLMATFVRKKGYAVQILDADALDLSPAEVATVVSEVNPLLTAVVIYGQQPSASTQNMPGGGAACSAIKDKEPSRKILMIGGHVAALPERTLREEDVDFVAQGEGLYTLIDLIEAMKTGHDEELKKVRGLMYREGDVIRANEIPPNIKDLDEEMPSIAWDLLPMDRYRAHNWHCFDGLKREPYVAIYTTLGCPFKCTFCCIQAPFKGGEKAQGLNEKINSYRFWSPETIVADIDVLVNEYGVRNIKFADELFVLNRKHVLGIVERIIERGYDLNIWAYARIDTVKEGMVEPLKRAGINWFAFGIESGNARVRNEVDKELDQESIYKVVREVQAGGINVIGNYIFGLPEDNNESMQDTLNLALDLNCEMGNFYSTMAYPGSPLYRQALAERWELPKNWSGFSQHSVDTFPLRTKYLTSGEVLAFRDKAFYTYSTSPTYLNMIKSKFGEKTVEHIKKMTEHKLIREHIPENLRDARIHAEVSAPQTM